MLTTATLLLTTAVAANDQWTTRSPMPHPAGQAAVVKGTDGRFYLFGGWSTNPPVISQTVRLQIYDPRADAWSTGLPLPVWSIGDTAIQAPDDRIHLFNAYFEKVAVYNPSTNAWEGSHAATWIRYSSRAVRTADNRYFIFGGERCDHTTCEYFPATFTIEPRAPVPDVPDPQYNSLQFPGAYVCDDGGIFVIGGLPHLYKVHGMLDNVARYDPADDAWTTAYQPMPTARFTFGYLRGFNGFLYAIGGSNDYTMQAPAYLDMLEYYDPVMNNWLIGPPLPEGRRESAAGIDDNGVIYIFGGSGPPDGDYRTTVYALDTRVGIQGPAPGDIDRDGDVDADDFQGFQHCSTGPALGPPAQGCDPADLDNDNDVDQSDFGLFQRELTPSTDS